MAAATPCPCQPILPSTKSRISGAAARNISKASTSKAWFFRGSIVPTVSNGGARSAARNVRIMLRTGPAVATGGRWPQKSEPLWHVDTCRSATSSRPSVSNSARVSRATVSDTASTKSARDNVLCIQRRKTAVLAGGTSSGCRSGMKSCWTTPSRVPAARAASIVPQKSSFQDESGRSSTSWRPNTMSACPGGVLRSRTARRVAFRTSVRGTSVFWSRATSGCPRPIGRGSPSGPRGTGTNRPH